jgi:hypothetical protein
MIRLRKGKEPCELDENANEDSTPHHTDNDHPCKAELGVLPHDFG